MELRFFFEIFCNISATFGINPKKELAISWRIKYNRRRLILFLCGICAAEEEDHFIC